MQNYNYLSYVGTTTLSTNTSSSVKGEYELAPVSVDDSKTFSFIADKSDDIPQEPDIEKKPLDDAGMIISVNDVTFIYFAVYRHK